MEEESRLVDATVLVDALTKEVKEACEDDPFWLTAHGE